MQVLVTKPEVEKFIDAQVQAGNFASPKDVVEAGVARLMLDQSYAELDDDDMAAIAESEEQILRGKVRPFREAARELSRKYLGK
jgi:Arc/MetJ-type ribon-helix-helix transcriptional regulator